jgi:hypothetical protein
MYSSNILDLGTRLRWVVSFTPGRFYPGERSLGTQWTGRWVGAKAGLDAMEKRKILPLSEIEPRAVQPVTHS